MHGSAMWQKSIELKIENVLGYYGADGVIRSGR